jgi:hypothetical protein
MRRLGYESDEYIQNIKGRDSIRGLGVDARITWCADVDWINLPQDRVLGPVMIIWVP